MFFSWVGIASLERFVFAGSRLRAGQLELSWQILINSAANLIVARSAKTTTAAAMAKVRRIVIEDQLVRSVCSFRI